MVSSEMEDEGEDEGLFTSRAEASPELAARCNPEDEGLLISGTDASPELAARWKPGGSVA